MTIFMGTIPYLEFPGGQDDTDPRDDSRLGATGDGNQVPCQSGSDCVTDWRIWSFHKLAKRDQGHRQAPCIIARQSCIKLRLRPDAWRGQAASIRMNRLARA